MEQKAFISVIYQTEINPQTYACKHDLRLLKKNKICICCVFDHYFLIGIYKMKTTGGGGEALLRHLERKTYEWQGWNI